MDYDEFRTSAPEGTEATTGGKWSASNTPNVTRRCTCVHMAEGQAALVGRWCAIHSPQEVDARILAGQNDFVVGGSRYTVPTWHREPIKRLRVEWARWSRR